MTAEPGARMLDALPALFAASDESGDLARLLGAFEALFFDGDAGLPGIERRLDDIPALFDPQAQLAGGDDRFAGWLAAWLGFTPYRHFEAPVLRRVAAGLVPMYGRRGTRGYLLDLLKLCFAHELSSIDVDDRPPDGFIVGAVRIGKNTRLTPARPFRFNVLVALAAGQSRTDRLERSLRAVIDFAKPAHTRYELTWAGASGAAPEGRR